MKRFWFVLLSGTLIATAQVKTPPIGIARFADGSVRSLSGLAANVIVAANSFGSYDAVSFSDSAGLVASHGLIQLVTPSFQVDGEYSTKELHPLLNVDADASSAIAWLPASQALVRWDGSRFVETAVNGIDRSFQATAVRLTSGNTAQLLLSNATGAVFNATISLQSGELQSLSAIPGITGPAFRQGSDVLFQEGGALRMSAANGITQVIAAMDGPVAFQRISTNWVLVTSSGGRAWAVHISNGQISASEVPQGGAK